MTPNLVARTNPAVALGKSEKQIQASIIVDWRRCGLSITRTATGGDEMTTTNFDAPVLIAGGGLVGLSAAMFLAQHGVRSLAIERRRNVLLLPRAAFFHMRTIELFRSCGIDAEVRAQSEDEFTPEGAVVAVESLAGKQ